MKKLILTLTLFIAGAQAQALSILAPTYAANLNKFYMQVGTDLEQQDIRYGSLTVDVRNRQIRMELQPAMPPCPAPNACIQVMPMPVVVAAPLLSIKKGGCGETVYTAEKNMMPVDGALVQIQVIDNRNNYCEIFPIIPTVVELHIETGRPFKVQDHVMHGEILEVINMGR